MTVTIVGSQFGDEGKGGIVDVFGEAATLAERGLDPDVRVAERAHVILPYHRVLDGLEEVLKGEDDIAVGTTGRGIGPTYEDKAGRRGVRVGDLLAPEVLRERLEYAVPHKRALVEEVYDLDPEALEADDFGIDLSPAEAFDADAVYERYRSFGERLADEDMTVNCGAFLDRRREAGDRLLMEGAQGTGIDIDHGSYPYVTSSNPTAGGAAAGTGLGPTVVGRGEVIGIVKAYVSRVGTGPLPTELGNVEGQTAPEGGDTSERGRELASHIRDAGGEYGTVTGRPRRVGWLDMPTLRHAATASGFTGLAINHVDTLAGLDTVKVAHAYELDGEELQTVPGTTERWADCEPAYREFDGWPDPDWSAVADSGYDAIPENAQEYLGYIAAELDADIYAVGVGPGREDTVVVGDPFDHA